MAISPQQPVTAAVNNAANMSRTVNTSTIGRVDVNNTTDSTSPSTGALHTTGGLGVEKKAYIGTDLEVGNNINATNDISAGGNISTLTGSVVAQSVAADTVNAQAGTFSLSLSALGITASTITVTDQTVTNDLAVGGDLTLGGAFSFNGVISIANGGTNNGALSVANGGVLYTDGTKVNNVGVGSPGQVLQSNGAAAPTWETITSGSGGGGGAFKWYAPRGVGPVTEEEFEQEVYLFSEVFSSGGPGQYLTSNQKMTNSFAGFTTGQGFLYFKAYTPSTSGRYKFELTSTLIKDGTDSFGSTTNQHVTDLEIVVSGVANKDTLVTLAYTDATGLINGQTVDINDTIKFKLKRIAASTAEDSADIRLVPTSTELYI